MNYATWLLLLVGFQTTVVNGTFFKGTTFVHRISPLIFLSRAFSNNNKNNNKLFRHQKQAPPMVLMDPMPKQPIAGKLPVKVKEFIDVLRDHKKYEKIGSTTPKGLLLVGPPGVGKTAIARVIARTSNAFFLPVNSSEIQGTLVGLGVERIKGIFDTARKKTESYERSIVFFDEIDSIGASRSSYRSVTSDDAMYTLNELLTQMDGFKANPGIFVVGATNRKDILDSALLRPGRFEFIVDVPLPDDEDRYAIVQLYLQKMRHNVTDFVVQQVVKTTQGLSADHLKGLVNLAGIKAVRAGSEVIEDRHFLQAADDIYKQSGLSQDLSKHIL